MLIKPASNIRKSYKDIAELCKSSGEPVYLTNNGEGELVVMSIDAYESNAKRAQIQQDLLRLELEKAKGSASYSELDDLDRELEDVINAAGGGDVSAIG